MLRIERSHAETKAWGSPGYTTSLASLPVRVSAHSVAR